MTFPAPDHSALPIYVDLDGALVRNDTLWECFFSALKKQPYLLFLVPLWLLRGRIVLKRELAARASLAPAQLQYHQELLEYLRSARSAGRSVFLATGAAPPVAEAIAQHLASLHDGSLYDGAFFVGIIASGTENCTGARKLAAIQRTHSHSAPSSLAFEYWGNSRADLPIWAHTGKAFMLNASPSLPQAATSLGAQVVYSELAPRPSWRTWARHLRIHQWAKNLLVFLPVFLSHSYKDLALWPPALFAFFSISLLASGTYSLNDLFDLPSDRAHARKRHRPLASGLITLPQASLVALLLIGGSLSLAFFSLPTTANLLLLAYGVTTLWYSFHGKSLLLIDSITLAALYVLRVFLGAEATSVKISFWTFAYAGFLFASLALMKRSAEIRLLPDLSENTLRGRAYRREDQIVLTSIGIGTGMIALTFFALFIQSPDAAKVYSHPDRLFPLCVVHAYWISRAWMFTIRGEMHDDPVVFALKDRNTRLLGLISLFVVWFAR